jgi:chromosome segregation ATPase
MIKQCEYEACGQPFEAKRADAKYCSATCRAGASRARRAGVGTGSGPTTGTRPDSGTARPEVGPPDGAERLRVLEEKVMDLEGDVEAGEHERDELHRLRVRMERAVAVIEDLGTEARRQAETAAKAAVAPVQKELAAAQAGAVKRSDVAELRAAVERVERRLAAWEERFEAAPAPEERVDEIEQAVIELAGRVEALREEFDYLVQGIGA